MHFQNIDTFTYQKALLHALLLLVFKIVESFLIVSLRMIAVGNFFIEFFVSFC